MEQISLQKKGQIGILTVNRPQALNALNRAVLLEMKECLLSLKESEVRALILTGAGEKAFVAGADIKEMKELSATEMLAFAGLGQEVTLLLETSPFLTVAAVNGFCLGGGLELALGCDFIYASESACLGLPEVTLGLIPAFGGTQRLCRAVGSRLAKELVMSGASLSAEEALQVGLVNKVCPGVGLLEACEKVAQKVCTNSFFATQQAKQAINHGSHLGMQEALELEKNMCAVAFATPDRLEGMSAFVEKRPAKFI